VVAAGFRGGKDGLVDETDIRQSAPSILAAMGIAGHGFDPRAVPFIHTSEVQ